MTFRCILATIVLVVMHASPSHSKDLNLLSFSFDIPEHWVVSEIGENEIMATGDRSGSPLSLPFIIASACIPASGKKCVEPPFRKSPAPGTPDKGCGQAIGKTIVRSDRIEETRWVCSPVSTGGVNIGSGISLFTVSGSFLAVWYTANAQDDDVAAVLESVSRSLELKR